MRPGTEISTDFFNIGGGAATDTRILSVTVDGQTRRLAIPFDDLLSVYMDFIESGGLQEQFTLATSTAFNHVNAKSALMKIDQQCYNLGIADFGQYPVNLQTAQKQINMLTWVVPLILLILFSALYLLLLRRRDRRFWTVWFRGNKTRYDQTELPEFHSLRDSYQDKEYVVPSKLGLWERLREIFDRKL